MPSELPIPTIADLRRAFKAGVWGDRDENADLRSGATYDLFGGLGALVFHRLALRDRDIFRATYFDFAEAADLAEIAEDRFGMPLLLARRGEGTAYLSRPTAAAGAGTLLQGTRFTVLAGGVGTPKTFLVKDDVDVAATATSLLVAVEAEEKGPGSALDSAHAGALGIRVEDVLFDPSFVVTRIVAGDGSLREKDEAARARIRKTRFDARLGYAKAITDALYGAGAREIALFSSDFLAKPPTGAELIGVLDADGYGDVGLNWAFVADSSFVSSVPLLNRCRMAIDSASIAGHSVQVGGMQRVPVSLAATVKLWSDPGKFSATAKRDGAVAAILNYFETRQNPFYFRKAAIRGAILRAVKDVQEIALTTSYTVPLGGLDGFGVPIDLAGTEPPLTSLLRGGIAYVDDGAGGTLPIRAISRFFVTPATITVTVQGP